MCCLGTWSSDYTYTPPAISARKPFSLSEPKYSLSALELHSLLEYRCQLPLTDCIFMYFHFREFFSRANATNVTYANQDFGNAPIISKRQVISRRPEALQDTVHPKVLRSFGRILAISKSLLTVYVLLLFKFGRWQLAVACSSE